MEEASSRSVAVVVATLVNPGSSNPDAPGETFRDGAQLDVVRSLKGAMQGRITFSYSVQAIPDGEQSPVEAETVIAFIVAGTNGARGIKLLPNDEKNLADVTRSLARP